MSYLADLYLLQERIQEALGVYERLLKERPDSAVIHFNVGILYAKAGQWKEAVERLSRAVELDPDNLEARLGLGVSRELAGQLEPAKEEFLKALALEPNNTRLIHYLAEVCYRMSELEESAHWLTRYLSFQPREPEAYLQLGTLRMDQGRWEEAVHLFRFALGLDSAEEPPLEIWLSLGTAYQMGGAVAQAEEAFQRAVSLGGPEQTRAHLALGMLYQRLLRFEESEKVYRQAYRINPDDPELLNGLGYLYAEWGVHLEEAVALIQRALAQEPQNGAYLDSLGWAYFRLGRLEQAVETLKEASLQTPDPEVLDHLGQVYFARGNAQAAKEAWGQALSLHPKDPQIVRRLQQGLKALKTRRGRR